MKTNTEIQHAITSRDLPFSQEIANGFTKRQIAAAITPRIQDLILFPTEKCNFRCTYCYEDFEIGKMSKATQNAITRLIDRRLPELKKLNFSWFGGEPLMAKDVVLKLARHAHEASKEHGVEFHGGLTTNAYLLDFSTATELIEYRQDFFQITLDGIGDAHDALRRRADGRGTFQRIWDNLVAMKKVQKTFDCMLRIHVRRDNIPNLELLMAAIASEFGNDRRYRLDFQHLRDMGGDGGKTVVAPLSIPELKFVEQHLRQFANAALYKRPSPAFPTFSWSGMTPATTAQKNLIPLGESAGSRRVEDIVANEPYICYASRPNSLIIRANGRIGKCTVALSDERNDLGYLADDGTIIINDKKLQPWMRGLASLDVGEAGCPLGGLPIETLQSPMPKNSKIIPIASGA